MTMYEESKGLEVPRSVNLEVDMSLENGKKQQQRAVIYLLEESESSKEDWTMTTLKCRLVCSSWNKAIEE